MKRRIFAAVLATAMALSLAACGGGNGGGSSSSNPGNGSDVSTIAPGGSSSQPDGSTPDGSQPDGSQPDSSNPSGSGSEGDVKPLPTVTITLNKTSVKLTKAGAAFQLRYTAEPDTDGIATFTSSNPKVATIDESGNIKAVAPGKATITVEYDGAKATCAVTCDWKEETKPEQKPDPKPEQKPDPKPEQKPDGSGSGSSSGSGDSSTPSTNVDLSAFYSTITGKYEFGFLELADSSILDNAYPGLSGISAEQMLVYVCMISMNNGEFGLVQVKDSKDVDAVKAAFQSRIDYMVGDGNGPGGAQYPMAMDQWENNSRIVSNGNYVMMVVHENCDDIVNEFNALF